MKLIGGRFVSDVHVRLTSLLPASILTVDFGPFLVHCTARSYVRTASIEPITLVDAGLITIVLLLPNWLLPPEMLPIEYWDLGLLSSSQPPIVSIARTTAPIVPCLTCGLQL